MPNLDTALVRANLERIVADLKTVTSQPEVRERAGRLSRLASEVTFAYEVAFASSAEMPDAVEVPVALAMPTAKARGAT